MKKYIVHLIAILAAIGGVSYIAFSYNHVFSSDYILVDHADTTEDASVCGNSENPCNTIQAGIDAAAPSQSVKIASGNYEENIIIDKSLSLIGEGKLGGKTEKLLDGVSSGVTITPADASKPVIIVSSTFDSLVLKNIRAVAEGSGSVMQMAFTGSASNLFLDKVVFDGAQRAVANSSSFQPSVDGVKITNSAFRCSSVTASGLEIWFAQSDLEITDNYITNCRDAINVSNGGGLSGALLGRSSISKNNIISTGDSGIQIAIPAEDLHVLNNKISGAGSLESGSGEGIQIQSKNVPTTLVISGNKISNSEQGIVFSDLAGTGLSALVEKNEFEANSVAGLSILSSVSAENVEGIVVVDNNFAGNNIGLQNDTSATINAVKNYWGDSSGPNHVTNPSGTGDKIVGNTAFDPWYLKVNGGKLSNDTKKK